MNLPVTPHHLHHHLLLVHKHHLHVILAINWPRFSAQQRRQLGIVYFRMAVREVGRLKLCTYNWDFNYFGFADLVDMVNACAQMGNAHFIIWGPDQKRVTPQHPLKRGKKVPHVKIQDPSVFCFLCYLSV